MNKTILFKLCFFFSFLLLSFLPPMTSSAKSSLQLRKTYSSLDVGKSVTYQVRGMSKGQYCYFFSSSSSVASVKKRTGKVIARKAGKVKIRAIIYNKNGKKKKTLSDTLDIREPVIPHAGFKLDTSINPWNHRLRLSCNRILLKKEVKHTKIKLTKKSKPSFSVQANFSSLSADGKKVTYRIPSKDQKKMCPKNGSKDGTYIVSSPSLPKKLNLSYSERICSNSLVGYIYSCQNIPIEHAKIICKTASGDLICYSDAQGRYEYRKCSSIKQIIVSKNGYYQKVISQIKLSDKGPVCQNVFLHSLKDSSSFAVHVMDKTKKSIPHVSVYLLPDSSDYTGKGETTVSKQDALLLGETDSEGNLLFHQKDLPISSEPHTSTSISYDGKKQVIYQKESNLTTQNQYLLPEQFDKNRNYILYFHKEDYSDSDWNIVPMALCFNPNDFNTDSVSFTVTCNTASRLDIKTLSIKWDSSFSMSSYPVKYQYSIFSPEDTNPIYTDVFSSDLLCHTGELKSFQLPVCLYDGIWQIRLQAFDESENIVATSPTQSFQVKDHTTEIMLPMYSYTCARFLAYGAYTLPSDCTATFNIYEQTNTGFAFFDTITTPVLQGNPYTIKKTSFFIEHLCPNSTYLLCPAQDDLFCKEIIKFTPSVLNLHASPLEAETSVPLATLSCYHGQFTKIDLPAFSNDSAPTNPASLSICEEDLQTCETYPDTIVTFSDCDGHFLFNQIVSPSATVSSTDYIVDIYANKKVLETNQDSYQ